MCFLLSKRIVVLWTMTLKAAENSCLYAQICMILSNWWMFEGSPWEGTESSTILLWQQTAISAVLSSKYYWYLSSSPPWRLGSVVVRVMCRDCLEKIILCLSPFLLLIKIPSFLFSFSNRPSLCWSGDHLFADQETISPFFVRISLYFYFYFSISCSYVFSFYVTHTYLCLLFSLMMILYGMLTLPTSWSNSSLSC